MGLIVQKFGGSSVKDRDRIFNVARIVMNTRNAGHDVVVVVSAQGRHHRRPDHQGGGNYRPTRPTARWICCWPQARKFRFPC